MCKQFDDVKSIARHEATKNRTMAYSKLIIDLIYNVILKKKPQTDVFPQCFQSLC